VIFLALEYTIFSLPEAVPDPEICQKHVCGRGSAPDPARGAHDAPPDPLVGCGWGYPLPRPLLSRRLDVCPPPAENPGGAHVYRLLRNDSKLVQHVCVCYKSILGRLL